MSRHHHHEPPPSACCCGACCNGCSAPCCYYPAPPPQPSSASDHLLHAIAAHLLLTSAPPPPPQLQPQPQPQPPPAAHHANPYPYAYHQQEQPKPHAYPHPYPQPQQHQPPPPPTTTNPSDQSHLLLHSLLRRVAELESTLPHSFPSPPVPPPHQNPRPRRPAAGQEAPPSPPPRRSRGGPLALRELAARTIQAHFRLFLARRSRTLRQLKELAILRSKAAALRGSLSGRRGCADPVAVSDAAMGLLLHLDAIQGEDPMIREGKHAVSRELTRILEFVDKVLVKEHEEISMGAALDTDEYRLYHEGCNGAFVTNPPIVNKKKVSFYRNGEVRELHGEAEDGSEANESSESSSSAEANEVKNDNGKPGLAAPMPVHMESRRIAEEWR